MNHKLKMILRYWMSFVQLQSNSIREQQVYIPYKLQSCDTVLFFLIGIGLLQRKAPCIVHNSFHTHRYVHSHTL